MFRRWEIIVEPTSSGVWVEPEDVRKDQELIRSKPLSFLWRGVGVKVNCE